MSIIDIDGYGYSERLHEQNWAAEYARRLVTNEVKARIEADDAEAAARVAADSAEENARIAADTAEENARKAADSSLHSAITSEELVRKAADEAEAAAREKGDSDVLQSAKDYTDEVAIKEIPVASTSTLGGIKLYAVGGINRSGIVVYADGTAVINTQDARGISRDGAGQIHINPATQAEVTAGTEEYKPVVPKTLAQYFEKNKYKFDGLETDDMDHIIRLYKGCTDTDIDSAYDAGIYNYAIERSDRPQSEMKKNGLLFVQHNDGSVVQIMFQEDYDIGAVTVYSRRCTYEGSEYSEWSDWMGLRTDTFYQYSTTPEKIGAWIDGTPVWRLAFKATLNETNKEDKAFNTLYDLKCVVSMSDVKLITGGYASIDCGSVDSNNATTLDALGAFNWDNIDPSAQYISGYIDFVTAESNIKEV